MNLSNFDYHLPKELIAQYPMKPRDHSRLLVFDRMTDKIEHKHFFDLPDYLRPGDVLVFNNSRVIKARLIGKKILTGGKVEVFLLKKEKAAKSGEVWRCLIGGGGKKENLEIEFGKGLKCKIIKDSGGGTWLVEFNKSGGSLMRAVEKIGHIPLPPYIKRLENRKQTIDDRNTRNKDDLSYQTVYADPKKSGSVAAPTAGLHFTPALMKKLKAKGIQLEYVTLHVGLGTFAPVKVDDVKKHTMHSEWAEIGKGAVERIMKAKKNGRRIIAVGTTSVRTLEALLGGSAITEKRGIWTDIFIYPGYEFKIVDAMITNFHLPKSTLIMLLSAFLENKAGKGRGLKMAKRVYEKAIEKKYRFFSYGDVMLVL